jgi:V8-like Glu-specific endopeptidase
MNNYLNLSASLLGAATTIALIQPAALALTASQIDQIAEAVTVRIETPVASGSGVIIQRVGSTYTVLTAQQVVNNIVGNTEAFVIPANNEGQRYRVNNSSIQSLPNDIDLAILQFQSNRTYKTATLGNSDTVSQGSEVYVTGYPFLTAALNQPLRQFTQGQITAIVPQPYAGGYTLSYSNNTLPGMTGGPAFNSNGEVIGIHGRSSQQETRTTARSDVRVQAASNLAIPINKFREWNTQNNVVAINANPSPIPSTSSNRSNRFFWTPQLTGDAFPVGEENNQTLYSCRANYRGGLHPGKFIAGQCNFGFGGKEIESRNYEVLSSSSTTGYSWVRGNISSISQSFIGGQEASGEPLVICRAGYRGGIHPGKVVNSRCNIGYGGEEIILDNYEVLRIN